MFFLQSTPDFRLIGIFYDHYINYTNCLVFVFTGNGNG